ncbi:LamG-like jellyroll fold domain-containing protein [Nonomuraea sp. NPDC023979]|uniref:LamG-like jellyroll fold domain-containing protein n=1 Tax=Nonomuraea sp. NPDC023979 TaxID=3154796 RepID=UPI0033F8822D
MRRVLSWRRSAGIVAALAGMAPGLLMVQALPAGAATATSTDTSVANDAAASPVIPKQMAGTAAGFPSLLPAAKVGAAAVPESGWKSEVKPPKGAVPAEDRVQDSAPAAEDDLPAGVRKAEAAERSVLAVPGLVDVYPKQGYLVDSLTPTLRAWGGSSNGNYPVSYRFRVCDVESMSGTGCFTSGFVAGNRNHWTVPAGQLAWGKQYWWKVTVRDSYDSSTTTSPLLTFTTGVRQPQLSAWLATPGTSGQEFNQQTGNYTASFTDLQVATVGPPLSVVRTYNSLDTRTDGMFGAGWSTRWDMKIVKEVRGESTSALVTYPDGRQVRFRANGDGSFQPPPGTYATLAQESGGTWRLMDKAATSYLFNAQGQLTEITDRRGRSQTLTYDAAGKLASIAGVGGRTVTFTWQGGQVASVSSDAVDGQPLTWTYVYDAGRLTQVCAPVAAPNCTSYAYSSGSLYRSSVLNSDPHAYWRLGEASGSTGADLGNGAGNLTYQGITLGEQGALAGTTDTAATFKAGSVVQLPSNTIPHLGDQMSVEAWFKTTQSGVIMAAGTGQNAAGLARGAMLYVGTDGKLRGSLDTVMTPITSAGTVNDGQWHHVALTVAGQNQTLFLDGAQVGTMTATVTSWRTYATIGNGVANPAHSPAVPPTTGAFPFQGQLDEVAVYGKPLTAEEVQQHYAARTGATHQLSQITLPSGMVWASNTYNDKSDRIATHTDQHGGTWQIGDIVTEQQSGEAQVTVTDPDGNTLDYLYDAWRGYRVRGVPDELGHTTWYEYDQAGFLTKIIDRNDIAHDIYQDERGNNLGRKYCRAPGECAIEFWQYYLNADDPFDPRNDQVIAYRDGRSAGDTDNTFATTTAYNTHGEPTSQTTPATQDFPNGRTVSTAYTDGSEPAVGGGTTPAGLVETKTDARGNSWSYRYTAAGDLAEQTDPEGLVTKLEYDVLGRLSASTRISQALPDGVRTTFAYDGRSRITTSTAPAVKNELSDVTHTAQIRYTYDADGRTLTETVVDLTGGDPDRVTTYTYDAHGRQETVTDPEGGVVQQGWNERGWMTRVTDPRGTVIESGYSKRGELTSRTIKGWTGSPVNPQAAQDVVLESRAYDPGGRLTASVDAMGRKTTTVYWMDNRLKEQIADDAKLNGSTTPRDVVVRGDEYDPAGNLIEQMTGNGITINVFEYDEASRLMSQTLDPGDLARTTTHVYDANGNVTRTTRTAAGTTRAETTTFAYNKLNQPTRETIENGDQDIISSIGYDDRGLATSITDPRGNADGATAADFTHTLRYDALDRLVEATAPEVQVDKNGTATRARPTVRIGYDTVGSRTHKQDADGRTDVSAYDRAGRLTTSAAPSYSPPGGTAVTPVIERAYDAAGLLVSVTDPRGNVTSFDYDQLRRQVRATDPAPQGQTAGTSVVEYDMAGEMLATVDTTGARTEATYDDLGRQITATQIERQPTTAAYVTTMEYDDAGRLTKQIQPGNKVTTLAVNAAGEVTSSTDPMTNTTTMAFDLAGRLVKVINPLGNASVAEYDLAGRQTVAKDLDSGGTVLRTIGYSYDATGNPISKTSGAGHVTRQTFDALNRITALIEPVSSGEMITTSFGYDATGARTRLTDGRGNATWTSYNSLGLAETVTEPATTAHPNLADRTWTHLYDAAGNPTATIQPGGVRIDRTFDHLNRLTHESGTGGGATTAEKTFGYDLAGRTTTAGDLTVAYNDRGLPLSISKDGSQQTAYSYDALGNPTQRIDASGTAAFTWDNASRLKTATDPVTGRTLTYGYDKASNIKTITATTGQGSAQSFDYDPMNRPISHTLKNGSGTQLAQVTYGWDDDDNLTTKTTTGTAGAGTNTYGYDHAGRLTSWTAPGGAVTAYEWDASGNRTKAGDKTFTYDERNRLTSGDGSTYTYTPRGTLATETKAGATTQFTFDAFDRLIADGDSLYSYDALNRVTSRTRGTSNQTFAYSGLGNDLAAISAGGTVQARYARDAHGGLLGLQEGAGAPLAALSDMHGDLIATFNTALATSTAYDPFGTVTAQTGTATSLGYQGEYTDLDTGKVNMHARWYQPSTGTFTSRDTMTLAPSPSVQANRYTYANASPLTGIDPTGHATVGRGTSGGGGTFGWNQDPSDFTSNINWGQSSSWCNPTCFNTPSDAIDSWGGERRGDALSTPCHWEGEVLACVASVAETDNRWYFENFILNDVALGERAVAPDGYWDADAQARDLYRMAYYLGWSTDKLADLWGELQALSGGSAPGMTGGISGGSQSGDNRKCGTICEVLVGVVSAVVGGIGSGVCTIATASAGAALCGAIFGGLASGIGYWVETLYTGEFNWATFRDKVITGAVMGAFGGPAAKAFWQSAAGKTIFSKIQAGIQKVGTAVAKAIDWAIGSRSGRVTSLVTYITGQLAVIYNNETKD